MASILELTEGLEDTPTSRHLCGTRGNGKGNDAAHILSMTPSAPCDNAVTPT